MQDIKIQITIPGHGTYVTTGFGLDQAINTYLPASVNKLRRIISERTECDYSDLHDHSVLLIILADLDESARRVPL